MSSTTTLILLVATTWVSSTVAVAPCRDDIIAGLSKHKECYANGTPPTQQAGSGTGTHIVIPVGEFPDDVTCITASQDGNHAYVTYHHSDGHTTSLEYDHVVKTSYIEETDSEGIKYRLYVIRYENAVYAYHRCISEGGLGTGKHSVHVAVGCAYVKSSVTLATVETVKKCFNLLDITNYESLAPCDCQ